MVGLAACGPLLVSLPVVGKLSNGETAQGSVIQNLSTNVGTFDIATLSGLTCSGTYSLADGRSTITIPVTCSNGRKGTVIATRDATGAAGTAIGRIEGGLSGRFLFGYVSAQMQADFLKE